jgi:peroxisomal enoyl-CoA hydratase 2
MESSTSSITVRDAIIYALGIGYSEDPLNKQHLNFTYENSEDFKICPTYGNIIFF